MKAITLYQTRDGVRHATVRRASEYAEDKAAGVLGDLLRGSDLKPSSIMARIRHLIQNADLMQEAIAWLDDIKISAEDTHED